MTEVESGFTITIWLVMWIGHVVVAIGSAIWLMTLDWAEVILSPVERLLVFMLVLEFLLFSALAILAVPEILLLFG
ncbi:hypothetical protein [Marinivivus vitaminiproducens]|uniref:hypothetical protein n=1 Tax=Marinivivus vitaminiproducens TaxID=3035935 RepID=UPI0027A444A0|nr:hypothetical protein P4R82_23580 [Geminicoccaceae bacterium SCSIO 64248]WGF90916.1 hypothetical protein P4R82_24235 [Geminicoccaceae bacterium SCSIO 64248]